MTEHEDVAAALRDAGARFALLHGSRVAGTQRPDSDLDREFAESFRRGR